MAGDDTKVPRKDGPGQTPADPTLVTDDVASATPPGKRARKGREPREPVTIDLSARDVTADAAASPPGAEASETDKPDAGKSDAGEGTVPAADAPPAAVTDDARPEAEPTLSAPATQAAAGGTVPPAGRPFGTGGSGEPPRDARPDEARPDEVRPNEAATARSRPSGSALVATGIGGALGGAALALLAITLWPGLIPGHDAMQARLTSAEQAARAAATQEALRGVQQTLTQAREADARALREAQAATTQVQQGLADLRQNLRDPALIERIDRLETALAGRDGAPSPAALEMLRRLDTRMSALETRAGAQASASAAARLVVLGRIRDALAAGTPFPAEAKALSTLGIGEQAGAPLARVAGGPPSGGALRAQFLGIRPALLAREGESDLWSWAKGAVARAVSIRRVDDASVTPDAVAARLETALSAGRMREARSLWDALPQAARDRAGPQGASFLQALDARAQAEAAVDTLTGEALAALGQPQATQPPTGQTQTR
jgi:hypothetical protein